VVAFPGICRKLCVLFPTNLETTEGFVGAGCTLGGWVDLKPVAERCQVVELRGAFAVADLNRDVADGTPGLDQGRRTAVKLLMKRFAPRVYVQDILAGRSGYLRRGGPAEALTPRQRFWCSFSAGAGVRRF